MDADTTKTLEEKTNDILSKLPTQVTAETDVLVNLVKLLLAEVVNKKDLSSLQGLVEVQKAVTDNLVADNTRLQKQNKNLHERLYDLEGKVDDNEQHDRNINLILKGIPEEEGRNREDTTKKFVESLNQHYSNEHKLKMEDIARSHRLGKRKPGQTRPRPIIARFVRETTKMNTFREKKKLAKKGISLAENLTTYRAGLYKKARDVLDYKNVWTWEGRVWAVNQGGNKFQISEYRDIPGYTENNLDSSMMDLF